MFTPIPVRIVSPLEPNGAVPINIQDQHSDIVDLYLHIETNSGLLLASSTAADQKIIPFTAGHGALAGDLVCIKEGTHFFQALILSVATNNITLDIPLDHVYTPGAQVCIGDRNLNKNGSVTPVIAHLKPPTDSEWDITKMVFHIQDSSAMDSAKFGGVAGLTNGINVRKKNSIYKNIFNIKTNGEFSERNFSLQYDEKAPAGVFAMTSVRKFAGQGNDGVTIRLDGALNDELQVIIYDDLRALDDFRILAQGHEVVN